MKKGNSCFSPLLPLSHLLILCQNIHKLILDFRKWSSNLRSLEFFLGKLLIYLDMVNPVTVKSMNYTK